MPVTLKKSAVTTGLEKTSFPSNPQERQYQRMFKLPHNSLISHDSKEKEMATHSSILT